MKEVTLPRPGLLVTTVIAAAFTTGFLLAGYWENRVPDERPALVVTTTPAEVDLSLEREKERSRLKEELERMLVTADDDLGEKIKHELWELTLRAAMEKEVETLLAARGYRGNTVVIQPRTVTVVIKGADLLPAQAAAIGQMTAEITGFPLEQIRIIE
ncbi:MAG TPA: SpoIIIAH-like family protein [Firmicutes bacterium]|jgi:hypothetical protein|nr:SpoIIIAH-like family protein [Bacillota bacterium]